MVLFPNTRRANPPHRLVAGALLATGLSSLLSCTAFAQPVVRKPAPAAAAPSSVPAPVSSEPGVTTASYGDWTLRCQRLAGDTTPRVCEVAQTVQVQGQTAPVAQLAIGGLPGQDGLRVTTLLPGNISFPSSVRIAEGKDAKTAGAAELELAWRRCLPGGCLADAAATDAVLKGWRDTSEAGRITFKDAEGREIVVPISFRGLAAALDALAKEKTDR